MLGFDALGVHPLGRFDELIPISGMAWYGEWEPPYFPTKTKTEQIQTHFVSLTPTTLPVPISGQAYNYAWEPTPQRLFPHYLQIDQMQGILLAGTLPERAINPGYRLRLYDVEGHKYPVFIWKGQPAATPAPIPHPPVPPLVFPEGGIWGGALGQYCLGE